MLSENLAGAPASALDRLKSRTQPHHERIEAVVPLMRPDLTLDAYRRYLARLLPYYAPLEARLALVSWPASLDFPARRKASLLEADVRALGDSPTSLRALSPMLPRLESPSQAWGCLYVLEGSTLGSQILSRRVHEALGVTKEAGGAFLCGYGKETGPRWKQFGAALTAFFGAQGDIESAVTGAEETFATLTDWLARDEA